MFLQYGIDLVLALILICTVVRCAQLGLVRALAGIVAWIAAAAISLHFCGPLAQTVYDRYIRESVINTVIENFNRSAGIQKTADLASTAMNAVPNMVVKTAVAMGIDVQALRDQITDLPQTERDAAAVVEHDLLAPVIVAALKALSFIVLVMLIAGVIQLMMIPVGKGLHKTPMIGTTDHSLGAAFGILKGAVLVAVLAIVLQLVGRMAKDPLGTAVQNSKIVSFVAKSPFADGIFR